MCTVHIHINIHIHLWVSQARQQKQLTEALLDL